MVRGLVCSLGVLSVLIVSVPSRSAAAPVFCTGDCDGDGTVSVDQLILGVNIALGQLSLDACQVFDSNANGKVAIDELSAGVRSAIAGCRARPSALTLFPVGNRSVALGSTLDLTLSAFDPDDRPLSFSAAPVPLPANSSLDGSTGHFSFSPGIDQVGTISLTFSVRAGESTASETVAITVTGAQPGGTTALSGRILDTNDFVRDVTTPVVGATVSIRGTKIAGVSDASGRFTLGGMRAGPQVFDIDTSTANDAPDGSPYAGFHQGLDLIEGVNNVVERPFFLPRIALESMTVVDPQTTTEVSNPTLGVSMTIPAGTARAGDGLPFDGALSISEVPGALAPEALPDGVDPGMLITIQPLGVTFDTPAPISFPNIDGLAAGSEVDLWSLNPETGQFLVVGRGRVSNDGSRIDTISGGVRAADWHFFLPLEGIAEAIINLAKGLGLTCDCGSQTSVSSGELTEEHVLAIYRSFDTPRALRLVYGSLRADPQPIVSSNITVPVRAALPLRISARLSVGGIDQGQPVFTSPAGLNEDRDETIRQAVQFDATALPTGRYPYELTLTSHYAMSSVASKVTDQVVVQNETGSAFGAGWTLAELQRLHEQSNDDLLLVAGDGTTTVFQSPLDKWRKQPPIPAPRAALSAITQPDGIHVIGGCADYDALVRFDRHDVYDPATGSFTSRAPVPDNVTCGSGLAEVGGKLYLIGGSYGASLVREYDPALDAWRYRANAPGDGYNYGHIAVPIGGLIYVVSGNAQQFYPIRTYDPANDTWSSGYAPIPIESPSLAGAAIDGKIYVVGTGSELQIYDPAANAWSQGAALPIATERPSATVFDGKLYVLGGATRFDSGGDIDAVQIYDPAEDAWETGPSMPTKRDWSAAASTAEKVFVFGGWALGNAPLGATEELTLAFAGVPTFDGPPGDFSRLVLHPDGTFTRELSEGTRVEFDADGRETSVADRNGRTTRYEYDAQGRPIRLTDPAGFATTLDYTGERLAEVVDPAGRRTSFAHDAAGNLTRITDPDGTSRQFAYDGRHRLVSQTSKRGFVTTYAYDFAGRNLGSSRPDGSTRQVDASETNGLADLATGLGSESQPLAVLRPEQIESSFTNGNGKTTRFTTDGLGNDTVTVDALGQTTRTSRDDQGLPVEVVRADGARATSAYDRRGNPVDVRRAVGLPEERETTTTYDAAFGQPTSVTDADGQRTTLEYDSAGNAVRIVNAEGTETVIRYEDAHCVGLITSSTRAPGLPGASTTTFAYDPATCNLARLTDPTGGVTTIRYDAAGNAIAVTDGNGRTTRYLRDPLNRITRTIDATISAADPPCGVAGVTCSDYDAEGNLARVTDARGNATAFEYDELDRLIRQTDPSGRVETLEYDADGNPTASTDPDGRVNRAAYDALDRRISEILPTGTESEVTEATYDAVGNLTATTGPSASSTTAYNHLDESISATLVASSGPPPSRVDYTRTKTGLRASLTVATETNPIETVTYGYGTGNRFTTLAVQGTTNFTYQYGYDAAGTLTTRGPIGAAGVATQFTFDAGGRLTRMTNTGPDGGTVFGDSSHTYDAEGNVLTAEDETGTTTYTYDALYRLTGVSGPGLGETYTYDAVGNRLGKGGVNYTYDVASRLVSSSDGTTYAYDANGNLRTKTAGGATTTYAWNARNQLLRIDFSDGTHSAYTYDALGRRLSKRDRAGTLRRYVYAGADLVQELDANGAVRASWAYEAIDQPLSMTREGVTYYYLFDRLGSVVGLTDGAGSLAAGYRYDPWGNLLATEGSNPGLENPFRFTGREWDEESGLYYYRQRYYDPEVGRFISRDPLGTGYRYVSNNPTNEVDPTGLFGVRTILGAVAGLVVGAVVVTTLPATLTGAAAGTIGAAIAAQGWAAVALVTYGTAVVGGGVAGAGVNAVTLGGWEGIKDGLKGGLAGGALGTAIAGTAIALVQLGRDGILTLTGLAGSGLGAAANAASTASIATAVVNFLTSPLTKVGAIIATGFGVAIAESYRRPRKCP